MSNCRRIVQKVEKVAKVAQSPEKKEGGQSRAISGGDKAQAFIRYEKGERKSVIHGVNMSRVDTQNMHCADAFS